MCVHAGTVSYQPQEVLLDGRITRASDVYSFAMIMLEIFTGEPVFEGYSSSQVNLTSTLLSNPGSFAALQMVSILQVRHKVLALSPKMKAVQGCLTNSFGKKIVKCGFDFCADPLSSV